MKTLYCSLVVATSILSFTSYASASPVNTSINLPHSSQGIFKVPSSQVEANKTYAEQSFRVSAPAISAISGNIASSMKGVKSLLKAFLPALDETKISMIEFGTENVVFDYLNKNKQTIHCKLSTSSLGSQSESPEIKEMHSLSCVDDKAHGRASLTAFSDWQNNLKNTSGENRVDEKKGIPAAKGSFAEYNDQGILKDSKEKANALQIVKTESDAFLALLLGSMEAVTTTYPVIVSASQMGTAYFLKAKDSKAQDINCIIDSEGLLFACVSSGDYSYLGAKTPSGVFMEIVNKL